jgi:hypothetical protein
MRTVPYRLLGTATAAPNDYIELGTSSEAFGSSGTWTCSTGSSQRQPTSDTRPASTGRQGRIRDGNEWRFKGHAEGAVLAVGRLLGARHPQAVRLRVLRRDFHLPPLEHRVHVVEARP